jgi:V/A-type H+-transporting ATPase subunit F
VVKVGKSYEQSKKIAVIGDEDTIIGFGLTGIKLLSIVAETADNKKILQFVKESIENPEIGFVLITEQVAERIRSEFERLKQDKPLYPIFIELPNKRGGVPDRVDPIKTLIRRAIGMEIVKEN